MKRKITVIGSTVLSAVLVFGTIAFATTTTAVISGRATESTELLGNFEAELAYTPDAGGDSATLEIAIRNTSPVDNGGYLTNFVFNNPSYVTEFGPVNRISGLSLVSATNPNFLIMGGPGFNNAVKAQPFGFFDLGMGATSSFHGGGSPENGIQPITSPSDPFEVFVLSLSGQRLDEITAEHFTLELSQAQGKNDSAKFFVARFRGFEDGGSDKVPAGVDEIISDPGDGGGDGGGSGD